MFRSASPGKLTAFEEELFRNSEMTEVPVVMAVSLTQVDGARTLGMAYCAASSRLLEACEFVDDEHFCTLEAVIVQLGAKEVVIPKVSLFSIQHMIDKAPMLKRHDDGIAMILGTDRELFNDRALRCFHLFCLLVCCWLIV